MREVQLTYKQEEVAPATTSDLVLMNNGRTLKEELSTHPLDKFSREVNVTTSMEKIVDDIYDGAYESLVFKGKSLVNLIPAKTVFEKQAIGGTSGWRNSYLPLTQELKTNTIYTLFYKLETETKVQISIGGKSGDAFLLKSEPIREVGTHYVQTLLTTKPETSNSMSHLYMQFPDNFDVGTVKATNMVLLEGNYMDFNVPYFEGICDVKMPILRNVGKNLIDGTGDYIGLGGENGATGSNVLTGDGTLKRYSYIVRCKPNTTYTLTTAGTANRCSLGEYSEYPRIGKVGTKWGDITTSGTLTITTKPTTIYLVCYSYYCGTAHSQSEMDEIVRGLKVQLEESPTQTTYEDYKTNILRTSEEIVLRSLPNGVCDTYNARTGEYVKRIGERTLNGSEAWIANSGADKWFEDVWVFHNQESLCNGTVRLCDKLQAREDANENAEFIRGRGAYIFVYISKNKVQNHNANDFKTWLQSNPITVQYELAEPITTIVEPSTIPFAYKNGHIILESGYEGQSLLPELSYSAPASKNGVISTTSKAILKHEQRLHKFEDLLLRESILMDYRLTLSFLDKM